MTSRRAGGFLAEAVVLICGVCVGKLGGLVYGWCLCVPECVERCGELWVSKVCGLS